LFLNEAAGKHPALPEKLYQNQTKIQSLNIEIVLNLCLF